MVKMRVASELKKFKNLASRTAKKDETWFWRLQVAARDAIMSIDVSSGASPVKTTTEICDIFQTLLGGTTASLIIYGENGWRVEAATGQGAAEILGEIIDPNNGSVSSKVIKNKKPYYFSNIDSLREIIRQNHPSRHSDNIFCSFPLLSFDGAVMGVVNVGGMKETHPVFAVEKGSIDGALSAVAAKIAKLKKNEQVKKLESSVALHEERLESIRKDLEDLKESETIKERLLYMTIHDLKNPLSLVISNLAYLEGMALEKEAMGVLRLSRFGCERLLDMIKASLDSHKMGIGKFQLHVSCFDLADTIREVKKEFEVVSHFDDITIEYSGPENLSIEADGGVIRRILSNLLDNALRHSPIGGRITIGLKKTNGATVFSVRDEGEGVAEEDRERIFDAYEQAKSVMASSGKDGSYGLGLAFCKMAAEAHRGSIRLKAGSGKGAVFVVTIPDGLSNILQDAPSSFI